MVSFKQPQLHPHHEWDQRTGLWWDTREAAEVQSTLFSHGFHDLPLVVFDKNGPTELVSFWISCHVLTPGLTCWAVFGPVLLHLFESIVKRETAAFATFLNRSWLSAWWGEEVILHLKIEFMENHMKKHVPKKSWVLWLVSKSVKLCQGQVALGSRLGGGGWVTVKGLHIGWKVLYHTTRNSFCVKLLVGQCDVCWE